VYAPVTGRALVPGQRRGFHAAITSRSLKHLHDHVLGEELELGLVPGLGPASSSFVLAGRGLHSFTLEFNLSNSRTHS
jgi:hypothetical protein